MPSLLQLLKRGGHSTRATNARLLDWLRQVRQKAKAGYWMITPHKIPARIAFIRQLISQNEQLMLRDAECVGRIEQLSALNAELAAKVEQLENLDVERAARLDGLSKQSAMDRPLVFMHIPKTSGAALTAGLCEVLPSTARIFGYGRALLGTFRSFETMSPEVRQMICETLPPANGIDFARGHMAYSSLIQSRPAARFMTILREPRSRILSLWMYWRSHSDEDILPWGAYGRVVRLTPQPLVEFLNHPEAASQTDNIAVRMLLWPHPLIPDDGFIDSASDERLSSEAAARLKALDFVDVIENPRFEENVRAFLARPFVYRRVNESLVPSKLQVALEEELTDEALHLIEHRSRLDRELWWAVAAERITGADARALSDDTFRRTVTQYAALMRLDSTAGNGQVAASSLERACRQQAGRIDSAAFLKDHGNAGCAELEL